MTAPSNKVFRNGQSESVSGDQLNTFTQWITNVAALRSFIGTASMSIFLEGFDTINDGGEGQFYWNAEGTGPDDDGVTNVVPYGASIGCWTRFSSGASTLVNSVTSPDDTLTVDPTTGDVEIGINLDNPNTWVGQQSGTTPTKGDSTTKFATTEFVQKALVGIQGSARNLTGGWLTNTTATWTATELIVQDSSFTTLLLSAFNKTLNTALTGAGGLDAGTLAASTWYFVYAIYNLTTPTQNILMSASATTPTLPADYTYSALIGSIRVDGSKNIIGFKQLGRRWQYVVGSNLSGMPVVASGVSGSVSTPIYTAAAVTVSVPTPIATTIYLVSTINAGVLIAAPNNSYGSYTSSTNPPPLLSSSSGQLGAWASFLLESTNVYYASNTASGVLLCSGFDMNI
jgi:hypothetical protein